MFTKYRRIRSYNDTGFHRACQLVAGWITGRSGEDFFFFLRDCLHGKEGVRQITNSAEERKTLAEGGFIHYI